MCFTAKRFKKQIFLSIDVPPSFQTLGQEAKLMLAMEKALVDTLKELSGSGSSSSSSM